MKSTQLFRFGATTLACALTVVACGSGSESASVNTRKTKNGAITTAAAVELAPERTGRVSRWGEPIINDPTFGTCDIAYDAQGRWRACTSIVSMTSAFMFESRPPMAGPYYPMRSSRYEWLNVNPPENASYLVYDIVLTTGQPIRGMVRFVPKSSPRSAAYVATTTTTTSTTSTTTTTLPTNCMITTTKTYIRLCKPANKIVVAPYLIQRSPRFYTFYCIEETMVADPNKPESMVYFEFPFVIPGYCLSDGANFEALRFTVRLNDGTSIIDGLSGTDGVPEQFYPKVFNGHYPERTLLTFP